ncbi:hypothetical protein GCM10027521_50220 [Amycolatopsis cihanbeyliensis]
MPNAVDEAEDQVCSAAAGPGTRGYPPASTAPNTTAISINHSAIRTIEETDTSTFMGNYLPGRSNGPPRGGLSNPPEIPLPEG